MNILITGVGGVTPRSFALSLKLYSKYKSFTLVGTDINPYSVGLYQKDIFSKSYVVPNAKNPEYWEVMNNIIISNNIDIAIILPESEVEVWSKKNDKGELSCKVFLPDSSIVSILTDKAETVKALYGTGLVPKSIAFTREQINSKQLFEELGDVFWVRCPYGTSGIGSLKVTSEKSLNNWVKMNPNINDFLASTFLQGRNLACKLLFYEGNLIRAACCERVNYIMAKVAPSGVTGNTSYGRFLNEPKLADKAIQAMNTLFKTHNVKAHGLFTVDFKEDEYGEAFITEINVRHVAFTQCFAAAGANFAEDTIRLLDNDTSFHKNYLMYTFEEGLIFIRDVDAMPILVGKDDIIPLV